MRFSDWIRKANVLCFVSDLTESLSDSDSDIGLGHRNQANANRRGLADGREYRVLRGKCL